MEIKTDDLAYWFFRLNGFLTIVNFVVHRERRGETGTDVDILGVRFPYRTELFGRSMIDHKEFTKITSRPFVVIAEVKKGLCNLNGPWTSRERKNVDRVLRAVGIVPIEDIEQVADCLHSDGVYKSANYYISLICVGENKNQEIRLRYPLVPQITWSEIISFIYDRFRKYRNVKTWHQPWDENGQNLWDLITQSSNGAEFFANIEIVAYKLLAAQPTQN